MKTQFYFPAPVEVVKVTNENLAEVAEWCGGKVAATESRRVPGRMDSYVWVPTPKGNSISWAFPGMYITKRMVVNVKDEMKATYQVFRRDYFSRNYFDTVSEAVDKTWDRNKKKIKTPKPQKPANNPQKENDMEKNNGGIPIITEEEAAERKLAEPFDASLDTEPQVHDLSAPVEEGQDGKCSPDCDGGHPTISMEDAVKNVQDGIPGSEVITEPVDTTDPQVYAEDPFAGGQAIENSGEIESINETGPTE